jgi:phosphatidylinositol glycan class N
VVLIVGDGLRADSLFQTYGEEPFPAAVGSFSGAPVDGVPHALVEELEGGEEGVEKRTTPAPFLRGLIQSGKAQWGVSHTRVPTESRPGHVALIGGMYEDVSAVTRGWTTYVLLLSFLFPSLSFSPSFWTLRPTRYLPLDDTSTPSRPETDSPRLPIHRNPVPFDSVFNQSTHAYTFGSPDILPMFALPNPSRVSTWSYDEEAEDFSKDAVHLDLWVLERVKELFANATAHPGGTLDRELRRDGVVFFEHLLGLDTTGHSYRPFGAEYHRNIRRARRRLLRRR